MALASTSVWELRADGIDTNGGGFNPSRTGAGTDRSQQAAAFKSGSNLTVDGANNTDVLPDGHTPTSADIGNFVQVASGLAAGFYEIVSIQSGKWRLDRSPGATGSSGGVWSMGGALFSLGQIGANWGSGHIVWMRGGTYNYSTLQVLGTMSNGSATRLLRGYGVTRGDGGRPLISSTSATNVLQTVGSGYAVCDIEIDGNDIASIGIDGSSYGSYGASFLRCRVSRCGIYGIVAGEGASLMNACEVFDMKAGARIAILCAGGAVINSVVRNNPCWGIASAYNNQGRVCVIGCLVYDCTIGILGASELYDGMGPTVLIGNVVFGCSSHGIYLPNNWTFPVLRNNVIYGNAGWGYNTQTARTIDADYNALGANGGGNYRFTAHQGAHDVILTADPFVNAAGGDFSLNNVAGGGQVCRAAGFPGTFPGGLTTSYSDIGAVQHLASGGLILVED